MASIILPQASGSIRVAAGAVWRLWRAVCAGDADGGAASSWSASTIWPRLTRRFRRSWPGC